MRVVLDTNVLIALLVYADPRYAVLIQAWHAGELTVLSNEAVYAELKDVLERPQFSRLRSAASALAEYSARVERVETNVVPDLPRCRDPDDQKFLALAASGGARVLITQDKALLALRRRVPFAVETPAAFSKSLSIVN